MIVGPAPRRKALTCRIALVPKVDYDGIGIECKCIDRAYPTILSQGINMNTTSTLGSGPIMSKVEWIDFCNNVDAALAPSFDLTNTWNHLDDRIQRRLNFNKNKGEREGRGKWQGLLSSSFSFRWLHNTILVWFRMMTIIYILCFSLYHNQEFHSYWLQIFIMGLIVLFSIGVIVFTKRAWENYDRHLQRAIREHEKEEIKAEKELKKVLQIENEKRSTSSGVVTTLFFRLMLDIREVENVSGKGVDKYGRHLARKKGEMITSKYIECSVNNEVKHVYYQPTSFRGFLSDFTKPFTRIWTRGTQRSSTSLHQSDLTKPLLVLPR